jgi:hypothetical protein
MAYLGQPTLLTMMSVCHVATSYPSWPSDDGAVGRSLRDLVVCPNVNGRSVQQHGVRTSTSRGKARRVRRYILGVLSSMGECTHEPMV